MRSHWFCLTLLVLMALWTGPADARPHIVTVPESGIRLVMQPVYEVAPMTGFFPLRITLDNQSGRARTWFLRATQKGSGADRGASVFTQALSVQDRSEQTFEVYVPILATSQKSSSWAYQNVQVTLTGYGIRTAKLQSHASQRPESLPYMAMSEALHLRSWPVLTKALEKKKIYLYGSKLAPGNMPRQWRGYAGVSRLLITDEEWDGLPAEVHRAVVNWVLMGGELHLFHRHQLPRGSRNYGGFRFEGITSDHNVQKTLGLGHVALHIWDGQEIGVDYQTVLQTDAQHPARSVHHERLGKAYTSRAWPLLRQMPTRRFATGFLWVLGVFLGCYFILVGPFNVWRSAKRGKRLLLFFTTPVLAVVSSAILCVLLAMHAGFGAWGYRTTGVYLLPNQHQAVVMQEQVTKTAFMLQTDFSVSPAVFITPIPLTKMPGKNEPVYQTAVGQGAASRLSGDWFANNAVQAQFARALQATRAGVALVPGNTSEALSLRSSINAVLGDIFVRDERGQYWHGSDVVAGAEIALRPVSQAAYGRWRRDTIAPQAGAILQRALSRLEDRHGMFIAVAARAPGFAIETLAGINWKSQTTVIFGHLPSVTPVSRDGTLILQADAGG